MVQQAPTERRKHSRHPLSITVQFYHGPSQREYPARSVDVSNGGMLMYVPVGTPVSPGQPIHVTLGSHNRPEFAGLSEQPVDGTIVRVDRKKMLDIGHIPVGVRFA
ncbi:MAG: PilZ domain-containing protein [Phycisphaerae bacterium]|nr:PilZ domain-containing protein [Phycisphaerae bacterium]